MIICTMHLASDQLQKNMAQSAPNNAVAGANRLLICTYKLVGKRIGLSKQFTQRWLARAC